MVNVIIPQVQLNLSVTGNFQFDISDPMFAAYQPGSISHPGCYVITPGIDNQQFDAEPNIQVILSVRDASTFILYKVGTSVPSGGGIVTYNYESLFSDSTDSNYFSGCSGPIILQYYSAN